MIAQNIRSKLDPFISGNLAVWMGLPVVSVDEMEQIFGNAEESTMVKLGAYPAQRLKLPQLEEGRTLIAYARNGWIVMVEVLPPPDLSVLNHLPKPTNILPQEIYIEGAYAHEYAYHECGLLLTVGQSIGQSEPDSLIRCRGIRPISNTDHLSAELYMPLDTEVKW